SASLIEQLAKAHHSGLRHGGINERWIGTDNEVFGFGLAALYAAWRRRECGKIGMLMADPRFATPDELRGFPPSPDGDRYALAKLIAASFRATQSAEHGMSRRVLGANAFLDLIAAQSKEAATSGHGASQNWGPARFLPRPAQRLPRELANELE